ncbi:MAG: hypothetical protein K2J08_02700 [Ruminococcus sp.]|nr:hypothetical protein [Ruminococcus sp.]
MKELDRLAYKIISYGDIISIYEAVDKYNTKINAVELEYNMENVIIFLDSRNVCTAIIRKE